MKTLLRNILTIILLTGSGQLCAQVDPQVSQTWIQKLIYNPAAVTPSGAINITTYARQQYTGFNNAPSTQYIGVSNFFESLNSGLGIAFINDHFGVENTQNIKLQFTHKTLINSETILIFGLGAGILHNHIETSNLIFEDGNDPLSNFAYESETKADFDFGAELQFKNFTAGLSCLHLTHSTEKSTVFKTPRHYYLYGNYRISISDQITLIPGINFKKSGPVTQAGFSGIFNYGNRFSGGLSYRSKDAISLMVRIEIIENIFVGYAFDIDSGPVKSYSNGSHEIMLSARILKDRGMLKTPRFF